MPDANELLQRIASESAARVVAADKEAEESLVAFQAGKFEEYFQAKYGAEAARAIDEYRQTTSGGNGEAGG